MTNVDRRARTEEQPRREPTGDGVDTLYSPAYGQTYHSTHGALVEARHVFLDGTGVADRLARGAPTAVLEVGFGTGLNFLLTAREATRAGADLRYAALERDVLTADVLAGLNHAERLGTVPLREALLDWRRAQPETMPPGDYHPLLRPGLSLRLCVGDAETMSLPGTGYDAVYLDAFSPDTNPELWTSSFLVRLAAVLRPGGRLATYSARGSVRSALTAAGFRVTKRPGPPGKREMVVGVIPG